jgi:hypothetical protein
MPASFHVPSTLRGHRASELRNARLPDPCSWDFPVLEILKYQIKGRSTTVILPHPTTQILSGSRRSRIRNSFPLHSVVPGMSKWPFRDSLDATIVAMCPIVGWSRCSRCFGTLRPQLPRSLVLRTLSRSPITSGLRKS